MFCNLLFPKSALNWKRKLFRFSALTAWNNLPSELKLHNIAPLNNSKTLVESAESRLYDKYYMGFIFYFFIYCCNCVAAILGQVSLNKSF